jgi:hypothetical protein
LPSSLRKCDNSFHPLNLMFYRITNSGTLRPIRSRNLHDEMLLHCARIGFKP